MNDRNYRDAITGEYVTALYAEQHPETTVGEARTTDDRQRDKYRVERIGGTPGKHDECRFFVLDPQHDEHAVTAIRAYADAVRPSGLADRLDQWVGWTLRRDDMDLDRWLAAEKAKAWDEGYSRACDGRSMIAAKPLPSRGAAVSDDQQREAVEALLMAHVSMEPDRRLWDDDERDAWEAGAMHSFDKGRSDALRIRVRKIAAALAALAPTVADQITSLEALDALPVGSIVLGVRGTSAQRGAAGWFLSSITGCERPVSARALIEHVGPVTLLVPMQPDPLRAEVERLRRATTTLPSQFVGGPVGTCCGRLPSATRLGMRWRPCSRCTTRSSASRPVTATRTTR